jgi:putative heme-binding domain-containing protein
MYREVIEHPWSLPEEIKQYLDLNSGNDRGRIYRIVPAGTAWKRRNSVALGKATTAELVATLEHPNGWHRDTASRLLYERQDKSAVPLLARLMRESKSAVAKHHALGVLDGLEASNEESALLALDDRDAHVRERGIVAAERLVARGAVSPALSAKLVRLTDDPDARVRFQLAFTLETALAKTLSPGSPLAAAYTKLATRDYGDKWISAALLSGPPPVVGLLVPALTGDRTLARQAAPFVAKLIEIQAAAKPAEGYGALIDFVSQPGTSVLWLRALGDGLRRAGSSIEQADTGHKLATVFTRASATAADPKMATADRLEAVELLEVASYAQSSEALTACLAPKQPAEVQVAAIKTLAHTARPEVTATLLRSWPYYDANARNAALGALIGREDRVMALLEAIQAGKVPAKDLSASQVQALAHHKTVKVATLARKVLASVIPPSRAEVTAKFQPAIGAPGNAAHGKAIYQGRCMICHRAAGEGMELGPDFITVKSKGRDALLTAILDPHKEVAPQYIAFDVTTKDGNAYTGIITRDDATSLSLKVMGGAEVTVPRTNVKGSSSSGKSLMPEGLEAGMSVQDMADLLTFIETLN